MPFAATFRVHPLSFPNLRNYQPPFASTQKPKPTPNAVRAAKAAPQPTHSLAKKPNTTTAAESKPTASKPTTTPSHSAATETQRLFLALLTHLECSPNSSLPSSLTTLFPAPVLALTLGYLDAWLHVLKLRARTSQALRSGNLFGEDMAVLAVTQAAAFGKEWADAWGSLGMAAGAMTARYTLTQPNGGQELGEKLAERTREVRELWRWWDEGVEGGLFVSGGGSKGVEGRKSRWGLQEDEEGKVTHAQRKEVEEGLKKLDMEKTVNAWKIAGMGVLFIEDGWKDEHVDGCLDDYEDEVVWKLLKLVRERK